MTDSSTSSVIKPSKGLNVVLWILQIILAALFTMTGFAKLTTPIEKIAQKMSWVLDYPPLLIRFIGLCEVLGAIGLIVPMLTKIKPELVVWAAYGLTAVMFLAALFHFSRGEYFPAAATLIIAATAIFIARVRSKKAPAFAG